MPSPSRPRRTRSIVLKMDDEDEDDDEKDFADTTKATFSWRAVEASSSYETPPSSPIIRSPKSTGNKKKKSSTTKKNKKSKKKKEEGDDDDSAIMKSPSNKDIEDDSSNNVVTSTQMISPTSVFGFPTVEAAPMPLVEGEEGQQQQQEGYAAYCVSSIPFYGEENEDGTEVDQAAATTAHYDDQEEQEVVVIHDEEEPSLQQQQSDERSTNNKLLNYNIHEYLDNCDWKKLKRALANMDLNYDSRDDNTTIRDNFLLARNDRGETPLHTAVWKAPTKQVLAILQLLPPLKQQQQQRKEYILAVDNDGNTPLHLACANLDYSNDSNKGIDFSIIKQIIKLAPEAIDARNVHGDTPLHLLLASRAFQKSADASDSIEASAEEAIISLLLMTLSASMTVCRQNMSGSTLLHVAICAKAHDCVIMKLLELAPQSTKVGDNHGLLPLHYVAAFGTPHHIASEIVRMYPDGIYAQSEDTGDTPLHLLISNSSNFLKKQKKRKKKKKDSDSLDHNTKKLAEILIGEGGRSCKSNDDDDDDDDGEENEEDDDEEEEEEEEIVSPVLIRNNEDLTPLHAAALFNIPSQLTRMLMHGCPEAATAATTHGNLTPLHLMCASKKVAQGLENVKELSTQESCAIVDNEGRTPLAVAAENRKVTKKVVKSLTSVYPDAASVPTTSKGQLPLHLVVQKRKTKLPVVKAIYKAYPEGIKTVTNKGNTVLHEAVKYQATYDKLEFLIEKYPEALAVSNSDHELPIDRARHNNAPSDVIALLVENGSEFVYQPPPPQNNNVVVEDDDSDNDDGDGYDDSDSDDESDDECANFPTRFEI